MRKITKAEQYAHLLGVSLASIVILCAAAVMGVASVSLSWRVIGWLVSRNG